MQKIFAEREKKLLKCMYVNISFIKTLSSVVKSDQVLLRVISVS